MKNAKFLALIYIYVLAPLFFSVQAFGQTWLDATIRGSSIKKEASNRYEQTLEFDVMSRPYDIDLLPQSKYLFINQMPPQGFRQNVVTIRDGMNLSNQNLSRQSFANVEVRDANFSGSNFNDADFRQAVFVRCDFSKAWLSDVKTDDYTRFIDCNFEEARLRGRVVKGIPLEQVEQVKQVKAQGPHDDDRENLDDYSGDYFSDADEEPLDFETVVLTGAYENLTGHVIARSLSARRKDYSNFCVYANNAKTRLDQESEYLDFKDYDFSDSMLYNCGFSGVDFTGASFENAVLNTVSFSHCVISFEQIKSTWNYRNDQMDLVSLPDEIQAQLDREEFYDSESFKQKKLLDEEYSRDFLVSRKQRCGLDLCEDFEDSGRYKREGSVREKKCFYYSHIDRWDFSGMDLRDSLIAALSARGTNFTDAEIEGAFFQGKRVHMEGTSSKDDVSECKIGKEQLESTASYKRKQLRGVKFGDIFDLKGVDFSNFDLSNSVFCTSMMDADLTDADITGCIFDNITVEQVKSTRNYKTRKMEGIGLPAFVREQLSWENRGLKLEPYYDVD